MTTYTIEHEGEIIEIEIYSKARLEELKARCRTGNEKLNAAWQQIIKLDHSQERWTEEVHKWHIANTRLSAYCTQLQAMGFNDCLYLENGKKKVNCLDLDCRVCPSNTPYWEEDWVNLPSGGTKKML